MTRAVSGGAQLLSPAAVGDLNRSRVLQVLWDHGPQSRADLARLAGVTRGTIGNIVQALLDAGLLEEGEPRSGNVGKPAVPLWFAPRAGLTAAAAVDSSSVEAALVNARGDLLARARRDLDGGADDVAVVGDALVGVLAEMVAVAGAPGELLAAGVAVPGVYDPAQRTILGSGPVPALVGDWLPRRLEDELGVRVVLDTDARVQALGEKWFGDGRGMPTFASVQTGHGLGVGVVLDGRVFRGRHPYAAEFGHTCVVVDGDPCVCGLRGCWETVATLRWLRAEGRARGLRGAAKLTAADLTSRTDDTSVALLANYADHLAVGIANLHQVFAPEAVFLHGDVVGGGEPLRAMIQERTEARVFPSETSTVDVRLSSLDERAGLVGAAALVLSETFLVVA